MFPELWFRGSGSLYIGLVLFLQLSFRLLYTLFPEALGSEKRLGSYSIDFIPSHSNCYGSSSLKV